MQSASQRVRCMTSLRRLCVAVHPSIHFAAHHIPRHADLALCVISAVACSAGDDPRRQWTPYKRFGH
jgi:hypothetical protein